MQSNRGIFLRWTTLFSSVPVIVTGWMFRKQGFFLSGMLAGWLIANFFLLSYSLYALTPGQKKLRFHNGLSLLVLVTFVLQELLVINPSQGFILPNLLIALFLTGLLSIKTASVLVSEKGQPFVILTPFIFNACWIVFVIVKHFIT